MAPRRVSTAILMSFFLAVGTVGLVPVARADGDGPTFNFCYDYHCPKPHFSVLHERAARAPTPGRPIARRQAADDCCVIVGIDRHRSVVMAKDKTSGRRFQFAVPDRRLLGTLRPGQAVSVTYADMAVSVARACDDTPCPIVTIGQRGGAVAAQD